MGNRGRNSILREFKPQKFESSHTSVSFVLENKNKMIFLSSHSSVLYWTLKHLTSYHNEDETNLRVKDIGKQQHLLLALIMEKTYEQEPPYVFRTLKY